MVKRVIIQSSGSSPFRVSVAGVDASGAEFNDLIFDGNQPPLRLWGTGFVSTPGISFNDFTGGKNVSEGTNVAVFGAPSGKDPVFIIAWRTTGTTDAKTVQYNQSDTSGSAGGGICSGFFCPASFFHGAPGAPTTPAADILINYCVFKNSN